MVSKMILGKSLLDVDWSTANANMAINGKGWFIDPKTERGEVNIAEQEQAPDNPGIRTQKFSTHGVSIPVSIGHRPVTGNIIDASEIVPRLEGTYDYWVEYQIPLYGPQ